MLGHVVTSYNISRSYFWSRISGFDVDVFRKTRGETRRDSSNTKRTATMYLEAASTVFHQAVFTTNLAHTQWSLVISRLRLSVSLSVYLSENASADIAAPSPVPRDEECLCNEEQ
jgi:hypothetical protein